ncbi:MAG: cytochrome P450 [Byssovorax sp.]
MTTAALVPEKVSLKKRLAHRGDRVGMLLDIAATHPDISSMRRFAGLVNAHFISSADLAHEVLVDKADTFVKGYGLSIFAKPLLGNGLLTSEHDFHRRQRRMMAPAFVHKRIADYATVISKRTEEATAQWSDGATIDFSSAMMRLTLEVVGATLFGAEVGAEAEEIGEALTTAMKQAADSLDSFIPIPPSVPTPGNLRAKEAVGRLDATVYRLIRERRQDKKDHGDFLSMLLLAQDEDDGSTMTDTQVRDEAMNIFLAGHETTANALAWTFYLLSQHPELRARLEREVDAALGGKSPTLADLPKLPYAMQVFKEAMRLYPPAFAVARRATAPVTIGPYALKKNDLAIINILGMHRRADYFPEPNRFDPDRFSPEREKTIPRHAFLPFGAGARVCIGNHFALLEGQLAVAAIAQRVRLDPAPGAARVEPEPMITLRPKGKMPMVVRRRQGTA